MFTVAWRIAALEDLADLYVALSPADRQHLERDVHRLNLRLSQDPLNVGESREPPVRVTLLEGLVVYFSVDLPNGRVRVTRIHPILP
jgi:plasmid stabilization system protein ParE